MEFTFLTFNYGTAGRYVNGPGMCLHNLVTFLKEYGHKVNVFSILDSPYEDVKKVSSINKIKEAIDRSSVVHHWSGLDKTFAALCAYAKKKNKKVIIGPNLIDTVKFDEEKEYLKKTGYDHLLTVNDRLLFKIGREHNIPLDKVKVFMVGPNTKLWYNGEGAGQEDFILWKGNSKQFVKDIDFALELAKKMKGKYRFEFIGYPKPYDYEKHIAKAKKAKLYICTSISETMGLALAEQWAAGVPSITHPKIYLHGENYRTGIITNKTINDYASAIDEIMTNDVLWQKLSIGAKEFTTIMFSKEAVLNRYFYEILEVA